MTQYTELVPLIEKENIGEFINLTNQFPGLMTLRDPITGDTLLHTACYYGTIKIIKFPIKENFEYHPSNELEYPLTHSIKNPNISVETLKQIIECLRGINSEYGTKNSINIVNLTDGKDDSALHHAVLCIRLDIVEDLLNSCKAKINAQDKKGNAALHLAVTTKQLKIIHCLLSNGTYRPIQSMDNKTPMQLHIGQECKIVTFLFHYHTNCNTLAENSEYYQHMFNFINTFSANERKLCSNMIGEQNFEYLRTLLQDNFVSSSLESTNVNGIQITNKI